MKLSIIIYRQVYSELRDHAWTKKLVCGLLIEVKMHASKSHNWDMTKRSLNRGGLLIEVKMHCKSHNWDMTKWSLNRGGLLITGGNKSRFHCTPLQSLNDCVH